MHNVMRYNILVTNKEAHTMQSNNYIAIYNAADNELLVVTEQAQVQNYWRQLEDDTTGVYTLTDFAFVDSAMLADYEHEDFVEDGWEVLQ